MSALPPFDPRCAWFLDIDGTLLDIAAMPAAVHPAPADSRLVTALYAATNGALALISGRSLAGIDPLFAPLKLAARGARPDAPPSLSRGRAAQGGFVHPRLRRTA